MEEPYFSFSKSCLIRPFPLSNIDSIFTCTSILNSHSRFSCIVHVYVVVKSYLLFYVSIAFVCACIYLSSGLQYPIKSLSLSMTTSRAFLPRDAMRKHCLCCRPVSIRLSVTLVYCIQTAKDIVKLLFHSIILVS